MVERDELTKEREKKNMSLPYVRSGPEITKQYKDYCLYVRTSLSCIRRTEVHQCRAQKISTAPAPSARSAGALRRSSSKEHPLKAKRDYGDPCMNVKLYVTLRHMRLRAGV